MGPLALYRKSYVARVTGTAGLVFYPPLLKLFISRRNFLLQQGNRRVRYRSNSGLGQSFRHLSLMQLIIASSHDERDSILGVARLVNPNSLNSLVLAGRRKNSFQEAFLRFENGDFRYLGEEATEGRLPSFTNSPL